jgi:cholesterol transport system auxiliary component
MWTLTWPMTARWIAAAAALALAGCALSSKAQPLEFHYFSAEPPAAAVQSRPPAADAPRLRLGPITAADYLRYRIVRRDSAQSVEPYETQRWAEAPREYVRRALVRALFDPGALAQVISGAAPTLDVEVIAFEELVRPGGHAGRVQLSYSLHDDQVVIARGTVTAERPARGADMGAVAVAIGAAMDAASAELAGRIVPRLRAPAGPGEPREPTGVPDAAR